MINILPIILRDFLTPEIDSCRRVSREWNDVIDKNPQLYHGKYEDLWPPNVAKKFHFHSNCTLSDLYKFAPIGLKIVVKQGQSYTAEDYSDRNKWNFI